MVRRLVEAGAPVVQLPLSDALLEVGVCADSREQRAIRARGGEDAHREAAVHRLARRSDGRVPVARERLERADDEAELAQDDVRPAQPLLAGDGRALRDALRLAGGRDRTLGGPLGAARHRASERDALGERGARPDRRAVAQTRDGLVEAARIGGGEGGGGRLHERSVRDPPRLCVDFRGSDAPAARARAGATPAPPARASRASPRAASSRGRGCRTCRSRGSRRAGRRPRARTGPAGTARGRRRRGRAA